MNNTTGWPKISIVTPSFNQGAFLEQTLRSVIAQEYPNLEYIVIDGGSTDNSVEIIQQYSAYLSYWISEPDKGQTDALDKGFRRATGEITAWINSDDFYEEDTLFKVAKEYIKQPFAFLCGTCRMIDTKGRPIQKLHTRQITHRSLIRYWQPHFCPPQPSIFFQRKALEDLGYFDRSLHYAMDYDLWLRAVERYSFRHIDDNLSYYRIHEDSKSGSAGGFKKFIPEWRQLISRSLRDKPLGTKVRYHVEEFIHNTQQKLTTTR